MTRAVIFDMFETLVTHYNSPLYFSSEMAEDAGIPIERFQSLWRQTDSDRTIGKATFEEVLERILRENQCYSEELINRIVAKRIAAKEECFKHLHPEIIPMLSRLKEQRIGVGLISNCFSEEAEVIRRGELFPYFDVLCLSYELGLQKPDRGIYQKCMMELGVKPEECLYVGDGGSRELEVARDLGMKAVQAVWYLKEGNEHQSRRMSDFLQLEKPLDVLRNQEE